jgi:hypothetical protein
VTTAVTAGSAASNSWVMGWSLSHAHPADATLSISASASLPSARVHRAHREEELTGGLGQLQHIVVAGPGQLHVIPGRHHERSCPADRGTRHRLAVELRCVRFGDQLIVQAEHRMRVRIDDRSPHTRLITNFFFESHKSFAY